MRWLAVVPVLAVVIAADLPSCQRAKAFHCQIEFISRMCPDTCSRYSHTVFDKETQQTLAVFTENNLPYKESSLPPQPPPVHQVQKPMMPFQPNKAINVQQYNQPQIVQPHLQSPASAQFGTPTHQRTMQPRQAQAPTSNQQYQNVPYQGQQQFHNQQPLQGQQQFQAQQHYQTQQQQYPSQQIVVTQPPPTPAVIPTGQDTLTLAPLINPPSAEDLNAQLIEQQRLQNAGRAPQIPGFGGAQPNNLFGQPGQTPLFNPFQPFLQQAHGAAAGTQTDPLNLFGLPTFPPLLPTPPPATSQQQFQPQSLGQLQAPQVQLQGQYPNEKFPQQVNQQGQQYPQQGLQFPQQQQQAQQQYQQGQFQQQLQNQQIAPQYQTQQVQNQQTIARSIDSAPQQYEKTFHTGMNPVPGVEKTVSQCPRQPNWQPCISKTEANSRFKNCCKRLGDGCLPLCNYDANLTTMQLAVLTGRCPIGKVRDIMICASGYKDATACCEAYNVFETGYEHCRPYCNPAAGLPEGGLLSEKYKCLVKLANIQQCFYVSQNP